MSSSSNIDKLIKDMTETFIAIALEQETAAKAAKAKKAEIAKKEDDIRKRLEKAIARFEKQMAILDRKIKNVEHVATGLKRVKSAL